MKPRPSAEPAPRRGRHRWGRVLRPASLDALESRRLLSFSAVGPQFVVHNYIPDDQYRPAVAADAAGDFAVSFEFGPPGPASDIQVRRFTGDGEPYEGEFSVNTTVPREPYDTDVAMDADGDFVVTWEYYTKNGNKSDSEVYARRYDATGKPQGDEFRVNQITKGYQDSARVAMDAGGDFVVAWHSTSYTDTDGIRARRYGADGTPLGDEFQVSVYAGSLPWKNDPAIAMDAQGDFTIVWKSHRQDEGTTHGIYGRRYDRFGNSLPVPAGTPRGNGDEFRVNKTTAGDQVHPDIAMDMNGDFVVVWTSYDAAGTFNEADVFMQRFTSDGKLAGGEVRINDTTTKLQNMPRVATDADGDYLVAWQSYTSYAEGQHIFGKRYSADGTALPKPENVPPGGTGNEFRVGDQKSQGYLDVTRDAAGDAVIVWGTVGRSATASGWDVWAQRYDESTDPAGPIVSGVSASGTLVLPGKQIHHEVSDLVIMFSEALDITEGGGGYSPLDAWNYGLTRDGVDVSSLISGVAYAHNPQTNKFETKLTVSTPLGEGSYVLTVRRVLRDLAGNTLDGNYDGRPGGGDASVPFVIHIVSPPLLQSIAVNGGAAQRSQVKSLTLNFDQPVTLAAGAVRLEVLNTGGSGANDGSDPTDASSALATPTTPDGGKTWVFTLASGGGFVEQTGSLVDGIYRLSIDPTKVSVDGVAMSAAPAPFTFHRLFGDVNGNRIVNTLDYGQFRNTFGRSTGDAAFNAAFDFDGNGIINTFDYGQLRGWYGRALTY